MDCDLVVIGGGPGGYVAAIRAAQLGMKVVCVEERATLGGTCLNIGCMPSKALLCSSKLYENASKHFSAHGIRVTPELDLSTMLARKDKIVDGLTKGIAFLFQKNGVTLVRGRGRITVPGRVTIEGSAGVAAQTLSAPTILIATGSESAPLSGVTIDEQRIVSSTGALSLSRVPDHLVVIGGGVIGLELGSVWLRLGARVTVIEYLDRILPSMDAEVSKTMQWILKKQGMTFRLETGVTAATTDADGVHLTVAARDGAVNIPPGILSCDIALVCVGRRPRTSGLGLEELGVIRDPRGFIVVDADYRTNIVGIHAIGDCVPGPMLAHKAEDEAMVCVERLAGRKPHLNYNAVPGVVYTQPEAAEVGASEESLKKRGIVYKVGRFPISANSRARAVGASEGFVKLLADHDSDRLLGAHIISPVAGEMIHELAVVIEFGGAAEDVARICHAHPTFSEAVREAALVTQDGAIHA